MIEKHESNNIYKSLVRCVCFKTEKTPRADCVECGSDKYVSDHECPLCWEMLHWVGDLVKTNPNRSVESIPAFACEMCDRMFVVKDGELMITPKDYSGKEIKALCSVCDKDSVIPERQHYLFNEDTFIMDGYCTACAHKFLDDKYDTDIEITHEEVEEVSRVWNLESQNRVMSDPKKMEAWKKQAEDDLKRQGIDLSALTGETINDE